MEDDHPYHLVVVAGQEVPTHSGVPRGWAGVTKGLSVRGGAHKKEEAEKKDKDKEEKKDKEKKDKENSLEQGKAKDSDKDKDKGKDGDKANSKVIKSKDGTEEMAQDRNKQGQPVADKERPERPLERCNDDATDDSSDEEDELPELPSEQDARPHPSPTVPAPHSPTVHKHPQGPKGWSTMLDGGSARTRCIRTPRG